MPLMTVPPNPRGSAVRAAIAKKKRTPVPTGAMVRAAALSHNPPTPQSYRPLGGNVRAVPARQVREIMGDFSYGVSWPTPVKGVASPTGRTTRAPWQTAGDPGNLTAGEVFQRSMRGRLFETASGLVMAEGEGEYAEENSFWSQGTVDPMHNWLQRNDRSSAGTVMDVSMEEYGGGFGMGGFAMDGLASYSDFQGSGGTMALVNDIISAASYVTQNWAHPEYLSKKSMADKMSTMGYPANQIDGLLNMSLNLLSVVSPNTAAKLRAMPATSPAPSTGGGQTQTGGGQKTGGFSLGSIPVWVFPLVGVGAFLLIRKFKSRPAAA